MPGLIWSNKCLIETDQPSYIITIPSHCWSLDDTTGTRADAVGGVTLIPVNTPGVAPGVLNNAVDFNRLNQQYLYANNPAPLQMGDIDFTISLWVRLDDLDNDYAFITKRDTSNAEYGVRYRKNISFEGFEFFVHDGSNLIIMQNTTVGKPAANVWYHICCWHDSSDDTLNMQVNNGNVHSMSHTTGVTTSNAVFSIGRDGSAGLYMNGRIDDVKIWKYHILSTSERTQNFSAGLGCPGSTRPILPDGMTDGQIWRWNATASEWQLHTLSPTDINAAAANHSHGWQDIVDVDVIENILPAGNTLFITFAENRAALVAMTEYTNTHYTSLFLVNRMSGNGIVSRVYGSHYGTVTLHNYIQYENTGVLSVQIKRLVLYFS
ncbi:MAG: hypothetical protein GF393_12770 [Armatimonadia bacterium]|nr:hypothetical protein [Armatimonadia bacterium]